MKLGLALLRVAMLSVGPACIASEACPRYDALRRKLRLEDAYAPCGSLVPLSPLWSDKVVAGLTEKRWRSGIKAASPGLSRREVTAAS